MSTQNTAPDFGEPWHKQTAIMNKGVHWLNTDQFNRAVVCVNACAGMTDPAADIAAMRAKIESLTDMLHNCANLRQIARTELSENIEVMREAIREAHKLIEDWQLFWKDNRDAMSSKTWGDGFDLGGPTAAALAKLQPFLP